MKAILFDVDGTLVRLGGAGKKALVDAATELTAGDDDRARTAVDTVDFRGNTDVLILEQIAAELAPRDPGFAEELLRRYLDRLVPRVASSSKEVLPGVVEVLRLLADRSHEVLTGLLTGNVREGARIKLAAFGLGHLADRPGGFGDDGRERTDIARAAMARLVAEGADRLSVIVVGDTEHDIRAARSIGARAVAVATGWTKRSTLEAAAPDLLLENLWTPRALWQLIDALDLCA